MKIFLILEETTTLVQKTTTIDDTSSPPEGWHQGQVNRCGAEYAKNKAVENFGGSEWVCIYAQKLDDTTYCSK